MGNSYIEERKETEQAYLDRSMYHHQNHQEKNIIKSSARMSITQPERHLFLQGSNGNSGLVLSTDAKPRLKWTVDLHERFIEAVNQLGGAEKATPKSVVKIMGIQGLTLYHLKSHLQKYRLSKNIHRPSNNRSNKSSAAGEKMHGEIRTQTSDQNTTSLPTKNMHLGVAIQMQIEVQRRLHEQLEVQRHLQLRIEAQGKYLQSVLEKAQETLGGTNLGAAKVQISDLLSNVSTQCQNTAFSGMKELSGFYKQTTNQHTDCPIDSCLTSSGKNLLMGQEVYNSPARLKLVDFGANIEQSNNNSDIDNGNIVDRGFLSETSCGKLTMSIGFHGGKSSNIGSFSEERYKGNELMKKTSTEVKMPGFSTRLDLNTEDEDDGDQFSCKELDLNDFSWG